MTDRATREQITKANRQRRIEKDRAQKARAQRKKSQRRSKQEMALLTSPNFDPHFVNTARLVALTRKHFGGLSTEELLRAWLADEENVIFRRPAYVPRAPFQHSVQRRALVLANGECISVQQSATHYSGPNSVEMFYCRLHPLLVPYGTTDENGVTCGPYSFVPISVVAAYIDALGGLANDG